MWTFFVIHWWLPLLISVIIGILFDKFTGLEIGDGMGGTQYATFVILIGFVLSSLLLLQKFDVSISIIQKL